MQKKCQTIKNINRIIGRVHQEFPTAVSNWQKEICNSFLMYKNRRVSNDVAESLNALISTLLYITKGIRNVERRCKRIMYAVIKTGFMIKEHLYQSTQ